MCLCCAKSTQRIGQSKLSGKYFILQSAPVQFVFKTKTVKRSKTIMESIDHTDVQLSAVLEVCIAIYSIAHPAVIAHSTSSAIPEYTDRDETTIKF